MGYVITQTIFEDLVKLLGKRERNPSKWKYFGETIKKWSYHRKEGQENLDHIEKYVALESYSNGKSKRTVSQ